MTGLPSDSPHSGGSCREAPRGEVPRGEAPHAGVPRWDAEPGDAKRAIEWIDAWVRDPAMSSLVMVFGGTAWAPLSAAALLGYLDGFSVLNWDFRGGRERNLALEPQFSPDQESAISAAAKALGLDSTAGPRRHSYDAVLMTGGMVRAGIVKPRYLRELVAAGLGVRSVVFLGGFRPFAGDERELAARLGIVGSNEFDAMVGGLDAAFDPLGAPSTDEFVADNPNSSWRELSWPSGETSFSVLAAPSSHPESRRADSRDTFRFWAEHRSGPEHSVLVITTPVYLPYQGSVAVEILGLEFGLAVETVAASGSASDLGADSQLFLPYHKLQEIRSAIRGMRSLRAALVGKTARDRW